MRYSKELYTFYAIHSDTEEYKECVGKSEISFFQAYIAGYSVSLIHDFRRFKSECIVRTEFLQDEGHESRFRTYITKGKYDGFELFHLTFFAAHRMHLMISTLVESISYEKDLYEELNKINIPYYISEPKKTRSLLMLIPETEYKHPKNYGLHTV